MTTCPHGVEIGARHEPRHMLAEINGVPTTVPVDTDGLPAGKCACCKSDYVYDTPLDERRAKTRCPHCQAITADPTRDHLAGNPRLIGGPGDGEVVALFPGDTPADRTTVAGTEELGHYVLTTTGDYKWVPGQVLLPVLDMPPRDVKDVAEHYRKQQQTKRKS